MQTIELLSVKSTDDTINYEIVDNTDFKLLKRKKVNAWIKYYPCEELQFNLQNIPTSILSIPISLYLFPITYFYPVELVIPQMDKTLFEDLENIKNAYSKLYGPFIPKRQGKVTVKEVIENIPQEAKYEKVVFFSGGVDACSAGINNPGKKSILVSIPSVEPQAKNTGSLRKQKFKLIEDFSKVVESDWLLISNNFNLDVFNNVKIQDLVKTVINDLVRESSSWFGFAGMANLTSVAPFAYKNGISTLHMGSAYEPLEDVPKFNYDANNPELSNSIKIANITFAEQDELYTRRSLKTKKVIDWCNKNNKKTRLWTCFNDVSVQCGFCPKCVRTQLNILVNKESPKNWGFENFNENKYIKYIKSFNYLDNNPCWLWDNIDAIDESTTYPYCNELLHWLKKLGYKEYIAKAKIKFDKKNKLNKVLRIFKIHRYPHYLHVLFKK